MSEQSERHPGFSLMPASGIPGFRSAHPGYSAVASTRQHADIPHLAIRDDRAVARHQRGGELERGG